MSDAGTPLLAVERALGWVEDGMVVGLGTGRAAVAFVEALARARRERGLTVRTVSSSVSTEALARRLGLPGVSLAEIDAIDLTVDGADEVDPARNLIKGFGGALLREKVLASISRRWVICVGGDKCVERLGARGKLPVEVVPFAAPVCARRLGEMGLTAKVREGDGRCFVTDNGNYVLDCQINDEMDAFDVERRVRAIPGVVETGYFLGMGPTVVVQRDQNVEVIG